MSSAGRNGFTSPPTPARVNWQGRNVSGPRSLNNDHSAGQLPPVYPRNPSFRDDSMTRRGLFDPRGAHEERVVSGPFISAGFPVQAHPPMRILIRDNGMPRDTNWRPTRAIPAHPPAFIPQQTIPLSSPENNSRLAQDEQNNALRNLKKEIYNPSPKNLVRKLSLYYRDQNQEAYNENVKRIDDEDGKRCTVCLEDFEPKETVVVTPCKHMFHEECIIPWLKSNGQCPVCRFVIFERKREAAAPTVNYASITPDDLFAGEIFSVIRAMEEAFIFGHALR